MTLKNDDTMRHLKPIRIVGLALEPVALDDGTLLFLHRRTDTALTGIAVIPAENIHEYALTENMEYAAMTIPFDDDIENALHKAFPEKGVDTNFIFGERATRDYEDGELFDNDEELLDEDGEPLDNDNERKPHTLAEYENATAMHEGQFVHRTWSTKAEADAYMQGINDMYDWLGFIEVEDKDIKKED